MLTYKKTGAKYEILDSFNIGQFWIVKTPRMDRETDACFLIMIPWDKSTQIKMWYCLWDAPMLFSGHKFFLVDTVFNNEDESVTKWMMDRLPVSLKYLAAD